MRITNLLPIILVFVTKTAAYWRGFNLAGYEADGKTCKTKAHWSANFDALHSFPNKINAIRLYTSYGCNTLAIALPYAISTQTKIVVGINPLSNYDLEKQALVNAITTYGWSWIASISVGNENLYRLEITPTDLAAKVNDVRGILQAMPGYTSEIKVGHVDTSNAWTNVTNNPVIQACDFIGTDIYPYFQNLQNNSIDNALVLFQNGLTQVQKAAAKVKANAAVWVTETGWPTTGPVKGLAVPSVANAQKYWTMVACTAYYQINTFWFTLQDFTAYPSFGVLDSQGQELYNQTCPGHV